MITADDLERLLTVGGVAERVRKTRMTVWSWISTGVTGPGGGRVTLAAVKVGRQWMVTPEALDQFLADLNPAPAPARESPTQAASRGKRDRAALAKLLGGGS